MVGDVGVEPTRTGHMILSHTRLPVPPIPVVAGTVFMTHRLVDKIQPARGVTLWCNATGALTVPVAWYYGLSNPRQLGTDKRT